MYKLSTVSRGICMDLWQSYTDKNIDFMVGKKADWLDSLIANFQIVKIVWWICYDMSKGKTKILLQIHLVLLVKHVECHLHRNNLYGSNAQAWKYSSAWKT